MKTLPILIVIAILAAFSFFFFRNKEPKQPVEPVHIAEPTQTESTPAKEWPCEEPHCKG